MRIRLPGTEEVLEGTPLDIVSAMRSRAFGQDHLSAGDYAEWMAEQVRVRLGKLIDVGTGSDEEKCETLLRELVSHDLAERLHD